MPKLLFLFNLLENGVYCCHVRVRCTSASELQEILERNNAPNDYGWSVQIVRGALRGYEGKPLYEATLWLSKPLRSHVSTTSVSEPVVDDSVMDWPASAPAVTEPTRGLAEIRARIGHSNHFTQLATTRAQVRHY